MSSESHVNSSAVCLLGNDVTCSKSSAIIVGSKTVLACADSLVLISDDSSVNSSTKKYLEEYYIQYGYSEDADDECIDQEKIQMRLHKFHRENGWALLVRTDDQNFDETEIADVHDPFVEDENALLVHKNAIILHYALSSQFNTYSITQEISAVNILSQTSYHIRYEKKQLEDSSVGGGVFLRSGELIGMHISENRERDSCLMIAETDKRVHRSHDPKDTVAESCTSGVGGDGSECGKGVEGGGKSDDTEPPYECEPMVVVRPVEGMGCAILISQFSVLIENIL